MKVVTKLSVTGKVVSTPARIKRTTANSVTVGQRIELHTGECFRVTKALTRTHAETEYTTLQSASGFTVELSPSQYVFLIK